MTHQVYISFSSWDKPVADIVCRELEAANISCWIAPRDVSPGAEWTTSISKAIESCQIMVLILSSRSNSSRNVNQEIEKAIENSKQIIPMLIEDFQPGPGLSSHIQHLHWFDAAHTPLTDAVSCLSKNIFQTLQLSERVGSTDFQKQAHISQRDKAETQHFDAFISYRRATDAQTARLIRSEIQHRGFKVFMDVDDLRPGHFDEALLEKIEEAHSFILILSPGSLDNCANPDDWMGREVMCALSKTKNIIPIMMQGFVFPTMKDLPKELHPLLVHHGINYSHEFFDSMIEKIVDYLGTP